MSQALTGQGDMRQPDMRQAELASIPEVVRFHATVRPEKVAIRFDRRQLTFGELDREANRVAHALIAGGFRPGDRFAIVDKNRIEFYALLIGGLKAGGVHVAVNWRLTTAEMSQIVTDAGVHTLFVGSDLFDKVTELEERLAAGPAIVAIDVSIRWPNLAAWLALSGDDDLGISPSGGDFAFLFYTSGTTGTPKGVPVSHEGCLTQIRGLGPVFGFRPDAVNLMVMPTFHIAGTQWSLQSLFFGSTTIVLREFEPGAVLDAISRHGVTHMLLVPAMITLLLGHPALKDADLSTVEMVSYGGSPFAPSVLAAAMDALGCRFFQTYGLTEAAGAVTTLHADDHDLDREHLLWSAGKPVPWSEVRILDLEFGEEVAPGTVGEICVRSPANMAGYWGIPNEVSGAFRGEWLRTGDAGYFDEGGYLYLYDRVKDMIVTGGENVYPTEVENVLARHLDVADVGVIGVPSDRWGEAVHAVVVRRDGSRVTEAELIEFARAELAGFKLPKSVEFVADLPRNPSGKLLKRELRRRYWTEQARAVG